MQWKELMQDPLVVGNYQLLKDSGILDYINSQRVKTRELEALLSEAYDIFHKNSIEELVTFVIKCLSDKFIPSNLIFILNHGVMVNRIKTLVYKNLKIVQSDLKIETLEPYEKFFSKYTGTTSFLILESEFGNTGLLDGFKEYTPEIVVPVIGRSGLYGLILFGPKVLGQEYSAGEIAYIDHIIRFTSISIQNNIHYEHSVRDPKTGLYNHNFFVKRIKEEISRAKRRKVGFAVLVLDIDKFKHFNDTYGHLAGDEIIRRLASRLQQTLREEDVLSRFGGEEFTVLLPDADRKSSQIAAERLRKAVEDLETPYEELILKITISIGIAVYDESFSGGSDALLNNADTGLYHAKEGGRNRVSFSDGKAV